MTEAGEYLMIINDSIWEYLVTEATTREVFLMEHQNNIYEKDFYHLR